MNDQPGTSGGKRRGDVMEETGRPPEVSRKDCRIKDLLPGLQREGLVVRVVTDVVEKPWGQGRRSGTMVSCLVGDDTGEIRVIGFNTVVDRVRDILVRDRIIDLSVFDCRTTKEDFRTTVLKLEIVLCLSSVLTGVSHVPRESLIFQRDYIDLKTVHRVQERIEHICGIVTNMEEPQSIKRRTTGTSVLKSEVLVIDEGGIPFGLTLWEPNLTVFDGRTNPLVSVSNVRLRSFRDTLSGNLTESSMIEFDPDNDRSRVVREWWTVKNSETGLFKSGHQNFVSFVAIGDDVPDCFVFWNIVKIVMIKSTNCLYKGCSQNGCQKKLEERDGEFFCSR